MVSTRYVNSLLNNKLLQCSFWRRSQLKTEHIIFIMLIRARCEVYTHILFVFDEELKEKIRNNLCHICLIANRLSCNCSHSGVNVHAHLLR